MKKLSTIVLGGGGGLFLMVSSAILSANVTGEVDLLPILSDGVSQNKSLISTWTGSADITTEWNSRSKAGKSVGGNKNAKVEFASKPSIDAVMWRWRQYGPREGDAQFEPYELSGFHKSGRTVRTTSFPVNKRPSGVGVIVSPSDNRERPVEGWGGEFDPFVHFHAPHHDASSFFKFYYENRNNPEMYPAVVSRNGSKVTVEITDKNKLKPAFRQELVFDLKQGSNLVRFHSKEDHLEVTREVEYEQFNGVFIPVRASQETIMQRDADTKTERVQVNFVNNTLNENVSDDVFSFEGIGVRDGDVITDNIASIQYTYKRYQEKLSGVSDEAKGDSPWITPDRLVNREALEKDKTSQPNMVASKSTTSDKISPNGYLSGMGKLSVAIAAVVIFVILIFVVSTK